MTAAVEVLDLASCEFHAMGTDVHVLVLEGIDDDLQWACDEIERLEALWSRFRGDSEVVRVNEAAGHWVPVSMDTIQLVLAAHHAWAATGGAFDPLLGNDLAALGYDRDFAAMDPSAAGSRSRAPLWDQPDHAENLAVDVGAGAVRVGGRAALDLGGIAKGWTADRVVRGLLGRGAAGACVNLGGDLAVLGRPPHPSGWVVEVSHQAATTPSEPIVLRSGGIATSTTLHRAWLGPDGDHRHHLLDPRSGRPCRVDTVEVTVVADTAADAEVLTKVAFAAPARFAQAIEAAGAAALVTTDDGSTTWHGESRHGG